MEMSNDKNDQEAAGHYVEIANGKNDPKTTGQYVDKVMLLTPDQQNVLNGPDRQLIIGSAGTGKTILLQAKALELLHHGETVNVVVSEAAYANHWRYKMPGAKKKLRIINRPISQVLQGCFGLDTAAIESNWDSGMDKAWINFQATIGYGHMIIDDCMDSMAAMCLMKLAERFVPDRVIWISMAGFDMEMVNGTAHLGLLRQNLIQSGVRIAVLNQVMRCSKSIFQHAYKDMKWTDKMKPIIGHTVIGESIVSVNVHCPTFEEALDQVWKKVHRVIQYLNEKSITLNNLGIIVNQLALVIYFRNQCMQHGIKMAPFENETNALCIMDWKSASSFEWPIVVYVNCMQRDHVFKENGHERYYAMSRAKVKLIDIQMTYEDIED